MESQIFRFKGMDHIKGFIVDGLFATLAIMFPVLNEIIIFSLRSFTEIHEFLIEIKDFLNVIVVLMIIAKFGVEIYKLVKAK